MPTDFLTEQTIGDVFRGDAYNANLALIEAAFADLGPWVISGLLPVPGTGLTVDVSTGSALFGGQLTVAAPFTIGGLTDGTTNHVYLLKDGSGTSNTTGIAPADSVKLGTALCSGGATTACGINPDSGRQSWTNFKSDRKSVRSISTNTTLTADDHTVGVDTTAGNVTVTLPPAATVPGQLFEVKKALGGNNVILDGDAAEPIDGAATQTITALNGTLSVRSRGTAALGWWTV
jgi:hypothetical protein